MNWRKVLSWTTTEEPKIGEQLTQDNCEQFIGSYVCFYSGGEKLFVKDANADTVVLERTMLHVKMLPTTKELRYRWDDDLQRATLEKLQYAYRPGSRQSSLDKISSSYLISPEGRMIDIEQELGAAAHSVAAQKIIQQDPELSQEFHKNENPLTFLLERGWIRTNENSIEIDKWLPSTGDNLNRFVEMLPGDDFIFIEMKVNNNLKTIFEGTKEEFFERREIIELRSKNYAENTFNYAQSPTQENSSLQFFPKEDKRDLSQKNQEATPSSQDFLDALTALYHYYAIPYNVSFSVMLTYVEGALNYVRSQSTLSSDRYAAILMSTLANMKAPETRGFARRPECQVQAAYMCGELFLANLGYEIKHGTYFIDGILNDIYFNSIKREDGIERITNLVDRYIRPLSEDTYKEQS